MPEARTHRHLLALTAVMAALFCVPQTAPGKALGPSQFAQSELWEPQPERVQVELVRIPGRHLVDFAITTPNASGIPSFLTRDPAGFVDGPNLYTYVNQNPWSMVDPLGLAGGTPGYSQDYAGHTSHGGPKPGHVVTTVTDDAGAIVLESFPTQGGVVVKQTSLETSRRAEALAGVKTVPVAKFKVSNPAAAKLPDGTKAKNCVDVAIESIKEGKKEE